MNYSVLIHYNSTTQQTELWLCIEESVASRIGPVAIGRNRMHARRILRRSPRSVLPAPAYLNPDISVDGTQYWLAGPITDQEAAIIRGSTPAGQG